MYPLHKANPKNCFEAPHIGITPTFSHTSIYLVGLHNTYCMILTIYIALNPLRSNPRKKAFYPKQWRAEGGR